MAKVKSINISGLIGKYDDEFINSISLKNISSMKELKELTRELETANYVVTSFYEMMYNDYIMSINNDCEISQLGIEIDALKRCKELASKIQRAYSYVLYLHTFENPFKVRVRKQK